MTSPLRVLLLLTVACLYAQRDAAALAAPLPVQQQASVFRPSIAPACQRHGVASYSKVLSCQDLRANEFFGQVEVMNTASLRFFHAVALEHSMVLSVPRKILLGGGAGGWRGCGDEPGCT